jgi:hypothetical protein
MPVADPDHGPGRLVLDEDDWGSRRQIGVEEPGIGVGQPPPLDPEIAHPGDHQFILDLVVHLLQHHIRGGVQEARTEPLAEAQRVHRPLRIPGAGHRDENGAG